MSSKSFSITRGTHSRSFLGTSYVFGTSLSRTSHSLLLEILIHVQSYGRVVYLIRPWGTSCNREWLVLLRDVPNTLLVPKKEREWVPRVIENDLFLLRDESNTQRVPKTGREWVPRVIENELLLLRDESNTQRVPRTGREWVPRVIENELLLLRDESNTQHVPRKEREWVERVILYYTRYSFTSDPRNVFCFWFVLE
jgi:hypothetical protein